MQTPTSLSTLDVLGIEARAILNELDELFPPVNPNPSDSIEQIMYRAGQRSVIEYIKHKMDED